MKNKPNLVALYRLLAAIGFLATWYYNSQYILEGGSLMPAQFFGAAFANLLTTALTIDVYLSALVFSIWVVSDSKRHTIQRPWLYIALCFLVGLAVAFPLYLAVREKALNEAGV